MEDLQLETRRVNRPGLLVLTAGILTGMLTLAALYFLNIVFEEFHAMGFYINGVIPFGAILVGMLAGSGYGIASWLSGAKISGGLLVMVIALQIAVYFFAQYVEYLAMLADEGASFCVGSDAHDINQLQNIRDAWQALDSLHLPADRVWRPADPPMVGRAPV